MSYKIFDSTQIENNNGEDLAFFTRSGRYRITNAIDSDSLPATVASGNNDLLLDSIFTDEANATGTQTLFLFDNDKVYKRRFFAGVIGAWSEFGTSSGGGGSFEFIKCTSAGTSISAGGSLQVPLSQVSTTSNFSLASNQITVVTDGFYAISGNITIESTVQRLQAIVKVYVNGVFDGVERGGCYIRNSSISYDLWGIVYYTVKELSANDVISFEVEQVQSGSSGVVPNYKIASASNEILMEKR